MATLSSTAWSGAAAAHATRADALVGKAMVRRSAGEVHPIEDFLYDYYGTRPARLRRWHPGVGTALLPGAEPIPHGTWKWYATASDGSVALDGRAMRADREENIRFIHELLTATASREPFLGCFGLHEWAMAYRTTEHRHPLPLRLGQAGTDAVVEAHQIRCAHFDAFRFFTPAAEARNLLQPTRQSQPELEQPGCLHATMDCHKWATKLGPAVAGEIALDCFELAKDVRLLDMQASPYDLAAYGEAPVPIETTEGKAAYVTRQRDFAARGSVLRQRLLEVCKQLLDA